MSSRKDRAKSEDGLRYIARNRKARFNFEILERIEAGLVLQGTEVKSLRAGRCNLGDSYADFQGGEAWLKKVHISPYEQGNRMNHDPFRPRKLLLHNREIRRLQSRVEEKGLTLVPLSLYFKRGKVKCELALARGKRLHDKRAAAADREVEKKMRDAVRGGVRSHD